MSSIKVKCSMIALLTLAVLYLIGCYETEEYNDYQTEDELPEETEDIEIKFEEVTATEEIRVPDDYSSIQEAIDNAKDGEKIIVNPGTYYENINMQGKEITLQSSDPGNPEVVEKTIIDGGGKGSVVVFNSGESTDSKLIGFTITGGTGTRAEYNIESYDGSKLNFIRNYGGGVLIANSSPTIAHNIITGNSVKNLTEEYLGVGGGIAILDNSAPHISDNTLKENFAEGHGGGIAVWYQSNPVIENNSITGNEAENTGGGIMVSMLCKSEIRGNNINGNGANWGGGIYVAHMSEADITSNQIESNKADLGAGVFVRRTEKVYIADNLISYNKAERLGGGIYVDNQATAAIHYNFIENNQAALEGGGIWVSKDSRAYLIWLDNESLPHFAWPDQYNNQGNTPDNINLDKDEYAVDNFINIPLRYKNVKDFMEKAFPASSGRMDIPEFNCRSELNNQDMLSMVAFSSFTTTAEDDQGRSIISAENIETNARIIFGLDADEVIHEYINPYYAWDGENDLYFWDWPAGAAGDSKIKVIDIEETADSYIVDTVHIISSFCLYYYDGDYIYDDYGNLVTHLLGHSEHGELYYIPFMPVRRFILTKMVDGNYFISQNYKLP